jgi:hypothetical protein
MLYELDVQNKKRWLMFISQRFIVYIIFKG